MPEDLMAEEVTEKAPDEEIVDDAGDDFVEDDGAFGGDESGPDDEDEPDPDEVEADLNEILRDRIAADEDEDEEEDAPAPVPTGGMVERQDTELHCPHCFLLIQAKTVAETGECGHCGGPIT